MSEPAVEPGVGRAVFGVGDKTGCCIAARPEVVGESREVRGEGRQPFPPSSWGQRPVNMLACEARVHGAVARASVNVMPRFASRLNVRLVSRGYPYKLK